MDPVPPSTADRPLSDGCADAVLFIGGTGMLLPAVHTLLTRQRRVVVVARRPERAGTHALLRSVRADWAQDAASISAALRTTLAQNEVFGQAIVWVHEPHATKVHATLAPLLASDAVVVHVVGSSRGNPRTDAIPDEYKPPRRYRRVILGFAGPSGNTRWLTDEEISEGALRSLDSKDSEDCSEIIVGHIEPWDEHP